VGQDIFGTKTGGKQNENCWESVR